MDIEDVDLSNGPSFHDWYEVVREVWLEAWPGDPLWASEDGLRKLFGEDQDKRRVLLVARDASGQAAGVAEVGLPQTGNRHVADTEVCVPPALRGRGTGRLLLEAAEERANDDGRTVHLSNTFGRQASADTREARFATAAGFTIARCEVRRELRLPLRDAEALEAANRSVASGYDLVSWWNRCPDELVQSRARLASTLTADEPRGDLDVESEQFDVERVRRWERDVATTGRDLACTGAVRQSTGELAAVTELGMPREGEDLAMQFATVVDRDDRGHRLGILTKLANLRFAADHVRRPARVCTWNAESNVHMIRVNERLGFEVVGKAINWQKIVAPG